MSKRRPAQRCTALAQDGSRCGRFCAVGAVVCAKHDPARKPTGAIAAIDQSPEAILRRLMRDKDPAIRLRAVNSYFDQLAKKERGCAKCADRAAREQSLDAFNAALTDDERRAFYTWWRDFREAVYARRPDLPRPPWDRPRVAAEPAAAEPAAAIAAEQVSSDEDLELVEGA